MKPALKIMDMGLTLTLTGVMFDAYDKNEILSGGSTGARNYLRKTNPAKRTVTGICTFCSLSALNEMARRINRTINRNGEPMTVSYADVAAISAMFVFLLFDDDVNATAETTGIPASEITDWRKHIPSDILAIRKV